jgi:hypothetical protein
MIVAAGHGGKKWTLVDSDGWNAIVLVSAAAPKGVTCPS